MALPYPNPDPATGVWDAFALKRNLEYLDHSAGSSAQTSSVLFPFMGHPYKDVTGTVLETSIFTSAPTIAGGTLGTSHLLRITLLGDILNNTGGAQAAILKIKYGATTVCTLPNSANHFLSVSAGASRYPWHLRGEIAAAGATNAQVAGFRFGVGMVGWANVDGTGVVEGGASGITEVAAAFHNSVAVDSTANQTFDVTIQPSTGLSTHSVRVFVCLIESV